MGSDNVLTLKRFATYYRYLPIRPTTVIQSVVDKNFGILIR